MDADDAIGKDLLLREPFDVLIRNFAVMLQLF